MSRIKPFVNFIGLRGGQFSFSEYDTMGLLEDGMRGVRIGVVLGILIAGTTGVNSRAAWSQSLEPSFGSANAPNANPLADTTLTPGKTLLFDLEAKFSRATAEGGGKAFVTWFAEDGVTLANNQPPVQGRDNIAKLATWLAKDYQLTWTPTEAVMSAAGDMGYTWGHYEGRSRDADGNSKVTMGRYLTIWRRSSDGSWKVMLEASQDEPAGAADCCKLPPGQ